MQPPSFFYHPLSSRDKTLRIAYASLFGAPPLLVALPATRGVNRVRIMGDGLQRDGGMVDLVPIRDTAE